MHHTYTLKNDKEARTVLITDADGTRDLNAEGEPCGSPADLAEYIRELHAQGAFDEDTRDELLTELAEDITVEVLTVERSSRIADGVDATVSVDGEELEVTLTRRFDDGSGRTWSSWGDLDHWISNPHSVVVLGPDDGASLDHRLNCIESAVENAALQCGLD